jgi:hypothetical protein
MSLRFISVNANRALAWKLVGGAIVLLGIASGCQTTPETDTPPASKIVRIGGRHNARAKMDGGTNWWALRVDQLLKPGAVIQTDKDSYVDIWLGETTRPTPQQGFRVPYYPDEGSVNSVRLRQDSAFRIDKVTRSKVANQVVEVIQLSLQRGRVLGRVKQSSAAPDYEIRFPHGVARIARDTLYEIAVEGIVRVKIGMVAVALTDRNLTREVSAGQQFDMRTDQLTPIPLTTQDELPVSLNTYPVSETRFPERSAVAPRRKF